MCMVNGIWQLVHNIKQLWLSWAKISHQWVKMNKIELLVELFNKFDSNTIHYLLISLTHLRSD